MSLETHSTEIKVFALGGGGIRCLEEMNREKNDLLTYVAIDTHTATLENANVEYKLQVGVHSAKGESIHTIEEAKIALEEQKEELNCYLKDTKALFLMTDLDTQTGLCLTSALAELVKKEEISIVVIGLTPFQKEAECLENRKALQAIGLPYVVMSPDKEDLEHEYMAIGTMMEDILKGLTNAFSGFCAIDFDDLSSLMSGAGQLYMGTGSASGKNAAELVATKGLSNPFMNFDFQNVKNTLVLLSAGVDLPMQDAQQLLEVVSKSIPQDAQMTYATNFDNEPDQVTVTIFMN